MLGTTKAEKSDEVKSNRVPYRTQRIARQIRPIRCDDIEWSRTVVVCNLCIFRRRNCPRISRIFTNEMHLIHVIRGQQMHGLKTQWH